MWIIRVSGLNDEGNRCLINWVRLNLTAANRVILMDIWWNPAVEGKKVRRLYVKTKYLK